MKMVLAMLLVCLFTGARVERVDRWVLVGLAFVMTLIIAITYVKF